MVVHKAALNPCLVNFVCIYASLDPAKIVEFRFLNMDRRPESESIFSGLKHETKLEESRSFFAIHL